MSLLLIFQRQPDIGDATISQRFGLRRVTAEGHAVQPGATADNARGCAQ